MGRRFGIHDNALPISVGEVRPVVRTDVRMLSETEGCPSLWGGELSGSGVVAEPESGRAQGNHLSRTEMAGKPRAALAWS
jgi:hypothetical protein